jgi:hypothetical protein
VVTHASTAMTYGQTKCGSDQSPIADAGDCVVIAIAMLAPGRAQEPCHDHQEGKAENEVGHLADKHGNPALDDPPASGRQSGYRWW